MARAILLSFTDNDAAEAFVKTLWDVQASGVNSQFVVDKATHVGIIATAQGHIEWMVAVPRNYCRCGVGGGRSTRNRVKGWTKTKRFGWWVHEGCNRVSIGVMKNFISNMLNGSRDLLTELAVKEVEAEEANVSVPAVETINLPEVDDGPRHWITEDAPTSVAIPD